MPSPDALPVRPGRGASVVAMAVVVAVGLIAYGRTFDVPWYFDDAYAVVENPRVHDLSRAVSGLLEVRWLTWLTFALNFALTGAAVAGFHAVNLAIHLAAGVVAFRVLTRILGGRLDLALLGALVFVAHPIQTQAVTYVVQRGASLAGLLCLLSVAGYLRFRTALGRQGAARGAPVWVPYAVALLAGALAVLAKENAAVLPGLLLVIEILQLGGGATSPARRRILWLAPFLIVPALLAARTVLAGPAASEGATEVALVDGGSLFEVDAVGGPHVTPVAYFATELEVVWRYLRRIVLPVGQVFDYGLPVPPDPLRWTVVAGGAGVIALLLLAWSLRRRAPPIAFGIGWFFVALAVESTFIPLDAYFEHRLYLPMFGVAAAIPALLDRLFAGDRRRIAAAGVVLVTLLVGLTLRRNEMWRDPVRLWRADLESGSQSYRSAIGLADALFDRGEIEAAEEVYRAFARRAEERCRTIGCGARYLLNLGVAHERLGEPQLAVEAYRRALVAQPGYARAHYNRGVVLYRSGETKAALEEFRRAAELSPADASALLNWATVALELGDRAPADEVLPRLRRLSPERARRLEADLADPPPPGSP